MNEIMVLSMLVGGLGELMRYHGGISWLLERVNGLARKLSAESPVKAGECCISLLVLLANLCTANNTVAIILTGKVAHEIAVSNGVDRRRSASLLDIFSCVVQGLIPYGVAVAAGLVPLQNFAFVHCGEQLVLHVARGGRRICYLVRQSRESVRCVPSPSTERIRKKSGCPLPPFGGGD